MAVSSSSPARVHGSLVEVAGVGVLLLGKSGIGKSECALELVMRGHRFVADDVVMMEADENGAPVGRSHEMVRHYIELRGIGIVHLPSLFGEACVAESSPIHLVVKLEAWDESDVERIGLEAVKLNVGPFEIAALQLPVAPGRNIATLVEVAARNHLLKAVGRSGVAELDSRVRESLRREGS